LEGENVWGKVVGRNVWGKVVGRNVWGKVVGRNESHSFYVIQVVLNPYGFAYVLYLEGN
jgi:hypothetical protein